MIILDILGYGRRGSVKRRTVFRVGAVLILSGLMTVVNGNADRIALAEEVSVIENEELIDTETEVTEVQNIEDESDYLEIEEIVEESETDQIIEGTEILLEEETERSVEENVMEIQLPQGSVQILISDFLPVQEEGETVPLHSYNDLYLLHIKNDQERKNTFYFTQALKEADIALYRFDPESNTAMDAEAIQDVMDLKEDGSVLSLQLKDASEYVLVINHSSSYENLGYMLKSEEPEMESETVSEAETQEAALESVRFQLDPDLETVPTAFSEYLNDLDVYTVTLIYEDGSEQAYDQTDERYQLSVDYEDTDTDGMIRRTYHATILEDSTGEIFEDTQYVDFGKRDPIEIKTEEMTSVILEGKKKWIMVQSTPEITGRYAMNSNKMIENIYYASDDGEIISAEDAFRLQQGMTYKFLIKLK